MELGTVSETGTVVIDLPRIALTYSLVSIVVITRVVSGMILADDRIRAFVTQLSYPIAQGIVITVRTTDENRILRLRIERHHKIRRRGMWHPDDFLCARKLRIQSVPCI